jgi:hypothetical protein
MIRSAAWVVVLALVGAVVLLVVLRVHVVGARLPPSRCS